MNQTQMDSMNLLQRAAAPTPKFFKKLQAIGATMLAATVGIFVGKNGQLPQVAEVAQSITPGVVSVAEIIFALGASIVTLCQLAVEGKPTEQPTSTSNK